MIYLVPREEKFAFVLCTDILNLPFSYIYYIYTHTHTHTHITPKLSYLCSLKIRRGIKNKVPELLLLPRRDNSFIGRVYVGGGLYKGLSRKILSRRKAGGGKGGGVDMKQE